MPLAQLSLIPANPVASVYRPSNPIATVYQVASETQSITNNTLPASNATLVLSNGQTFTPAIDPSNPQDGEFIVDDGSIILYGTTGDTGIVIPPPPQRIEKRTIALAPEWVNQFKIQALTFRESLEGFPEVSFEFTLNPVGNNIQEAEDYFDANTEHELLGTKYYCSEGATPSYERISDDRGKDRYTFQVTLTGAMEERATPRCDLKTQWDTPYDPETLRGSGGEQKISLRRLGEYGGENLYFYLSPDDTDFLTWRELHEELGRGRGFWYWGNNTPELRKFSDRPQHFFDIDNILWDGFTPWTDSNKRGGVKHNGIALAYEFVKTKLSLEKRELDAQHTDQEVTLLSVTRADYSSVPDRYAQLNSTEKRNFLSSNSVFHDAGGPTDTATWKTIKNGTTMIIIEETWGFQYNSLTPVFRVVQSGGGGSPVVFDIVYNEPSLSSLWEKIGHRETVYKFDRDRYLVEEQTTGWVKRRWKAGGVREIAELQQELDELIEENNGQQQTNEFVRERSLKTHQLQILQNPYEFAIQETTEYELGDLDLIYPDDKPNPIPTGYKSPQYLKAKKWFSSPPVAIPDIFSEEFETHFIDGDENNFGFRPPLPPLGGGGTSQLGDYPILSVGEENTGSEGQMVVFDAPDIFESFTLSSTRDTSTNNAFSERGFDQQLGRISEHTKHGEPEFPESSEADENQNYLHTPDSNCCGEKYPSNGEISFSGVGDRATALKLAQFQLTKENLAAFTRDFKYIPFVPMQVGDRARLDNRDWVITSFERTVIVEDGILIYGANEGEESYYQSITLGSYLPDIPVQLEII